ncbi:endochitinase 1 [Penicillium ochrochloron]
MTISISQVLLLAMGLATSALSTEVRHQAANERDVAVRNCVAFYRVASGDDCIHIQQAHPDTFTMEELYQWNPMINKDCTNLQVGYPICIRKLRKDCPTGA